MSEIKTPPVHLIFDDVGYVAFCEDHTLRDLARWFAESPVDAEEFIGILQEMLKNKET